ncbi:hypothetical protein BDZ91DRAFT_657652 [Kalaharituber pfeilii]|nr:hypothetical protein BDZ91DRAFT_657652 [Kalaharituber pfeilii]
MSYHWIPSRHASTPPAPGASSTPDPKFFPTTHQVSLAYHLLTAWLPLPVEIALLILDYADYNPALTACMAKQTNISANLALTDDYSAAMALLMTDPIPKEAKVKSITWWMKSKDQGWSGETDLGEYAASWTWFEACILRPSSATTSTSQSVKSSDRWRYLTTPTTGGLENPAFKVRVGDIDVSRWVVQRNARANSEEREHVVEWRKGARERPGWPADGKGSGEGFVEALKEGDRVVLIGRAMYPAWVNYVRGAEVEVRLYS